MGLTDEKLKMLEKFASAYPEAWQKLSSITDPYARELVALCIQQQQEIAELRAKLLAYETVGKPEGKERGNAHEKENT